MIVLWALGVLALLGTRLTSVARVQLRLATEARDQAIAESAADGAIRQSMFILLGGGQIGAADQPVRVRVGEAVVVVQAVDDSGKINPNTATRDMFRGLLTALGVDPAHAARLAGEMADWRTRGPLSVLGGPKIDQYRERNLPYRSGDHAFYSVDELGLLPDMTPDILARLRPWLSVYHEGDVVTAAGASPAAAAVGDALVSGKNGVEPGFVSKNVIVHVTADAVVRGRARFVRSATIRVRHGMGPDAGTGGDAVQVLTWD